MRQNWGQNSNVDGILRILLLGGGPGPLGQRAPPVPWRGQGRRRRAQRSLALLLQVKETALQEILLSDNELQSLADLNRFTALKVLVASRNALTSGPGVRLAVHKLTRLDLGGNKLTAIPPLQDMPLLQVRRPVR